MAKVEEKIVEIKEYKVTFTKEEFEKLYDILGKLSCPKVKDFGLTARHHDISYRIYRVFTEVLE